MAKRKSGGSGIVLFIIIAIIVVVANLFANILNFEIIYNFGFNQYKSNVLNFHQDSYAKSNLNLKVYTEVLTIKDIKTTKNYVLIPKHTNFKIKGTISKKYTQWVAVEFFKNIKKIDGYILLDQNFIKESASVLVDNLANGKNELIKTKYFHEISDKMLDSFQTKQFNLYMKKVKNKYNIEKVSKSIEKQKMSEDKQWSLLYSKKNTDYYYNNINEKEIDKLYNMYRGDNFDTIFLNISKTYNPYKDGVYSQNILLKLLNYKSFNLILIILVIFSFKYYLKYLKSEKCQECGSRNIVTTDVAIISEKYEYENKDGTPDKRIRDNQIIQNLEISEKCNNCGKEWYYETERFK